MVRKRKLDVRLRVRELGAIPPKDRVATPAKLWAWSRPHAAEEIARIQEGLHYGSFEIKEIHWHSMEETCPNRLCLLVDTVPVGTPVGADETRVEA